MHPDPSPEFFHECSKIAAANDAQKRMRPKPGTLGALLQFYFETEHFQNRAATTQRDYRLSADYLHPIKDTPVSSITTPLIAGIHDKASTKMGWRRANILLVFISQVFKYNIPHGNISRNFATGVIPKPRPKNAPARNRAWSYEEVQAMLEASAPEMRGALALIHCTGLDPTDALGLRRDQVAGDVIWRDRDKTKVGAAVPIGDTLRAELQRMPEHDALTVLASSSGRSWTYDGFQSSFQRLKKKLEAKGAIKPGLTPKGLRHTMATWLREAGRSERDISDLLAQKSPAMGLHYSKDADLARKNRATIEVWEEENKRRAEIVKPTKKSVKP
ncbi:tyrosine-type recombinase/integrase, partial [Citreicella sp. C3M06]|uniref:tyrosine-type recombinase/integrase n=1 Tax=Citreicella sp. C3M06 TaxID=2841564 RepID=UPI001C091365